MVAALAAALNVADTLVGLVSRRAPAGRTTRRAPERHQDAHARDWKLDVSAALIWYVQVAALAGGHVSGLALAHDRALVVYGDAQDAAASQRWMLVVMVMVTFTCLGPWLLSAVNT